MKKQAKKFEQRYDTKITNDCKKFELFKTIMISNLSSLNPTFCIQLKQHQSQPLQSSIYWQKFSRSEISGHFTLFSIGQISEKGQLNRRASSRLARADACIITGRYLVGYRYQQSYSYVNPKACTQFDKEEII